MGLDAKSVDRCKNFFALGMCYWLYNRSMDTTLRWIEDKFKNKPQLVQANRLAMQAGYSYCEATEAFQISYEIPPAKLSPGVYRNISGNTALAMGFVAASQKAGFRCFWDRIRSRRLRTFCTSFRMYKDFGVDHVSGRGRNRRDHFGDWRGLRAARSASRPRPVPAWRSRPKRWASPSPSSCRS